MLKNQQDEFKNKFKIEQIIFLGEIHGAPINHRILEFFADYFDVDIVLIELEQKWNKFLQKINKKNNDKKFLNALLKEDWLIKSGVISKNHLKIFRILANRGKKIRAIRVYEKTWNASEKSTADHILRIAKNNKNKKILLVMGNLHARKKEFQWKEGKKVWYRPVGLRLKNQMISVHIRYGQGKIKNFGIMKINNKFVMKKLKNKNWLLTSSKSKYFDYDFFIKNT